MNLRQTIRKILKEETSLPLSVKRRLNFNEENIINLLKKFALRHSGQNVKIDALLRMTFRDVAYELVGATQLQFGDEVYQSTEDDLANYLHKKYWEQLKEFIENFFDESGDELGSRYVFEKHSERYGGNGFTEGYETWNMLLKVYSSWFPDLDWKELKMKLDNMSSGGKILIKKPGDRNNIYNYYFSLQRFDVPNTRKREQNEDKQEFDEYARTLKNARRQGRGLRFSKVAIQSNPQRFRPYSRERVNENDPKVGTGKKPKGSGRRLYTDENPSDTVSVKFRTKEDIVDTLNKDSFKSKPHKRQSQIINLIHQRVRAAYQNSKDPETKGRLKRAYDYITQVKEKSKEKTIRLQKQEQNESELTERCWKGYTQKGMKTMFGKRYPNCVKKTKM